MDSERERERERDILLRFSKKDIPDMSKSFCCKITVFTLNIVLDMQGCHRRQSYFIISIFQKQLALVFHVNRRQSNFIVFLFFGCFFFFFFFRKTSLSISYELFAYPSSTSRHSLTFAAWKPYCFLSERRFYSFYSFFFFFFFFFFFLWKVFKTRIKYSKCHFFFRNK